MHKIERLSLRYSVDHFFIYFAADKKMEDKNLRNKT